MTHDVRNSPMSTLFRCLLPQPDLFSRVPFLNLWGYQAVPSDKDLLGSCTNLKGLAAHDWYHVIHAPPCIEELHLRMVDLTCLVYCLPRLPNLRSLHLKDSGVVQCSVALLEDAATLDAFKDSAIETVRIAGLSLAHLPVVLRGLGARVNTFTMVIQNVCRTVIPETPLEVKLSKPRLLTLQLVGPNTSDSDLNDFLDVVQHGQLRHLSTVRRIAFLGWRFSRTGRLRDTFLWLLPAGVDEVSVAIIDPYPEYESVDPSAIVTEFSTSIVNARGLCPSLSRQVTRLEAWGKGDYAEDVSQLSSACALRKIDLEGWYCESGMTLGGEGYPLGVCLAVKIYLQDIPAETLAGE